MIAGETMAREVLAAGFTHVVWIPDSHIGTWEQSFSTLNLIRPCREGEAVAIAAGLILGGARPLVAIQCTGLFEAGDAIRNIVHDLKLPLKLLVGVRSWRQRAHTSDNCPQFTEPFVKALQLPFQWFNPFESQDVGTVLKSFNQSPTAEVLLWAE